MPPPSGLVAGTLSVPERLMRSGAHAQGRHAQFYNHQCPEHQSQKRQPSQGHYRFGTKTQRQGGARLEAGFGKYPYEEQRHARGRAQSSGFKTG